MPSSATRCSPGWSAVRAWGRSFCVASPAIAHPDVPEAVVRTPLLVGVAFTADAFVAPLFRVVEVRRHLPAPGRRSGVEEPDAA